jgi:hypothetical protein
MKQGIEHVISIIDEKAHSKLTGYLGVPFEPVAGSKPFEYLGSSRSYAVYGHVPDFYPIMKKKHRTLKGWLARKALRRLVDGSEDDRLYIK